MSAIRTTSLKDIGGISVRNGSNVLKDIGEIWTRGADNVLRKVWSAAGGTFTAEALPVYGAVSSGGPRSATTNPIEVNIVGGVAPFAFTWSVGDAGWSIYGESTANPRFISPPIPAWGSLSTSVLGTVTDKNGATANITTSATCDNYGGHDAPL